MAAAPSLLPSISIITRLFANWSKCVSSGFFFAAGAAQGQIYGQAQALLGADGTTTLQGVVQSASKPAEGFFRYVNWRFTHVAGRFRRFCRASRGNGPNLASSNEGQSIGNLAFASSPHLHLRAALGDCFLAFDIACSKRHYFYHSVSVGSGKYPSLGDLV